MKRLMGVLVFAGVCGALLVGTWFSQQDPGELSPWLGGAQGQPPHPALPVADPPALAPLPPPTAAARACKAMTWGVRGQRGAATWVGALDGVTDAYRGDTPCNETRPLLCFQPGQRPSPEGFELPPPIRWTGGAIALLPDVLGLEIRSKQAADRLCAAKFGEGWRMAEFHDGGAWGFGAEGELPRDARFWVALNDQRANLWDR